MQLDQGLRFVQQSLRIEAVRGPAPGQPSQPSGRVDAYSGPKHDRTAAVVIRDGAREGVSCTLGVASARKKQGVHPIDASQGHDAEHAGMTPDARGHEG